MNARHHLGIQAESLSGHGGVSQTSKMEDASEKNSNELFRKKEAGESVKNLFRILGRHSTQSSQEVRTHLSLYFQF